MNYLANNELHPLIEYNIDSVERSFAFYSIELVSIRQVRNKCIITGRKPDGTNVAVIWKYFTYPPRVSFHNYSYRELYYYNRNR